MLYEAVAHVIADMCFHAGTPLSVSHMAHLLDDVIEERLMEVVCQYMLRDGLLVKFTEDTYTTRNMHLACTVNLLISDEYQRLGMTLLRTEGGRTGHLGTVCGSEGKKGPTMVRYIPPDAEHRFLHIAPSTLGPAAGMGLFVRPTRRIPQGCIFCEYRGRPLRTLPKSLAEGTYVVRVRTAGGSFLDGVNELGENLSLATFINDGGPLRANAGMMEYDRHPGRVFVVAHRDLQPGEEVFVLYGATYWGFTTYSALEQSLARRQSRRHGATAGRKRSRVPRGESSDALCVDGTPTSSLSPFADYAHPCRSCGELVMSRTVKLHAPHCNDPLVRQRLLHMDCLPMSEFTVVPNEDRIVPGRRARARRRATMLVDRTQPQTFSHTHEDIIGDLEFSFTDADTTAR